MFIHPLASYRLLCREHLALLVVLQLSYSVSPTLQLPLTLLQASTLPYPTLLGGNLEFIVGNSRIVNEAGIAED